MARKKVFSKILVVTFCLSLFLTTTVAFAATVLLSYNGTGIRDMDSAQTFELSSQTKITLKHNTTGVTYNVTQPNSKAVLTVNLMRKGFLFWGNTGDSITTTGIQSKTVTWTKSEGKYKLHFTTKALSETWWPGVNVNGTITK